MRIAVWPRRNWVRSYQYITKRVLRLSASPHVIALGFATGVFASFTPFLGFHFIICLALAFIMGGNMISSALGTFLGNPLTFPFIWISTYKMGNFILFGHAGAHSMSTLAGLIHNVSVSNLLQIIKPMTVGGILLGVPAGIIAYFLIRRLVFVYQRSRLAAMARRAEQRVLDKVLHRGDGHHE
ncbi:MAG: hypothetical protein COA52_18150 [Hyphomicrobiales bacterium]|nr:MAG: hypothetical protein COA52_18150 [Hyphomicrobiales bacterium]